MYFYRKLDSVFALSFDFDNTLYDNSSIIAYAEQQSLLFLRTYHPVLCNIQQVDCDRFRLLLYREEPDIYHNVTLWRWKALKLMLFHAGLSKYEASFGADFAMDIFIRCRNEVIISDIVRSILFELSCKWPLVGITNGNINPVLCGLENYFTYIFYAGKDGKSKPYEDMYYLAAKKLGLSCKNILHIGDNLKTDVQGAHIVGMQSCWTHEYVFSMPISITCDYYVPHLRISSLLSLTNLL